MKKLTFLLCLFVVFNVWANPENIRQVDQKIIHHIFNAQWQQADSLIDLEIQQQPDSPKYYYMKLPLFFYTRYFHQGVLNNDSLSNLINYYADKTIEKGNKSEITPQVKFYLGSAYGYKTRLNRNNMWEAYWTARQSKVYLQEALEEDSDLHDAKIGIATISYFTATRLNMFLRNMAAVVGLGGDSQESIQMFADAAQYGSLCKEEAKFILGTIYSFFENDYEQALNQFGYLREKYPDNPFFTTNYYRAQIVPLINENGIAYFEAHIDSLAELFQINNANILNNIGYYYLGRENYDIAQKIFKINIDLSPIVANGYDSYAESFLRMGDNENAIKYYTMAYEKLDQDTTITEQYREFLRTGIEDRLEELK